MSSIGFLKPRLRGARFEEGMIPRDGIEELLTLQEMVMKVARWQYLKNNSNQQRVPADFNKVDLALAGIKRGSTILELELTSPKTTLDGTIPYQQDFESAQEIIYNAFSYVEKHDKLPPDSDLPLEMLEYLKPLGRHFRNGESLEMSMSKHETPIRISNETHQKLVHLISTARHIHKVTLRGVVHEFDQKNMTFNLEQIHGSRITCHITDQFYDTVMKAFREYRSNTKVQIQGDTWYNPKNKISDINNITKVKLLDPLDVSAQLDELRGIKQGWLDGQGDAPIHSRLDWLSDTFQQHYPDDAPLPYVCPMPDGGVEMEWSIDKREISLEVDIKSHRGEWFCSNMDADESHNKKLNLDNPIDWKWVANQNTI